VSSSRLRRTAAAVALAVLALSGCGTNQAGAASVVGDSVVTDAQVADVASETKTQLASVQGATFDEKTAPTPRSPCRPGTSSSRPSPPRRASR